MNHFFLLLLFYSVTSDGVSMASAEPTVEVVGGLREGASEAEKRLHAIKLKLVPILVLCPSLVAVPVFSVRVQLLFFFPCSFSSCTCFIPVCSVYFVSYCSVCCLAPHSH